MESGRNPRRVEQNAVYGYRRADSEFPSGNRVGVCAGLCAGYDGGDVFTQRASDAAGGDEDSLWLARRQNWYGSDALQYL